MTWSICKNEPVYISQIEIIPKKKYVPLQLMVLRLKFNVSVYKLGIG